MAENKVYEQTVRMLDGDMKWTVTGDRQYGSTVCIEMETSVGLVQSIILSPDDARSIGVCLMDAATAADLPKSK